jgi:predicted ATP-dependent Lon-type protease
MKINVTTTEDDRKSPVFKDPSTGTILFVGRVGYGSCMFFSFESEQTYPLAWWDDKTFDESEVMEVAREMELEPFYGKAVITIES